MLILGGWVLLMSGVPLYPLFILTRLHLLAERVQLLKPLEFRAASQPRGTNMNGLNDVLAVNGSSQDQSLALTRLCVPSSLDSGLQRRGPVLLRRYRGTSFMRKTHPPRITIGP